MPTAPNTPAGRDAMLAADDAIERLATRLTELGTPGRLAEGFTGSAQICFRDAEHCFGIGDYEHAKARAERGLSYLR